MVYGLPRHSNACCCNVSCFFGASCFLAFSSEAAFFSLALEELLDEEDVLEVVLTAGFDAVVSSCFGAVAPAPMKAKTHTTPITRLMVLT